jgi:hypothetical protein
MASNLKERFYMAHELTQEAKGGAGNEAYVTAHLDEAEGQLMAAEEIAADLLTACKCALGYLTQGMDGDFNGEDDPVEVLRAALSKATD